MPEPRSLARYAGLCFERDEELRISAADGKLWFLALHELIRRGMLAEATFAAGQLSAAFPDSVFIRQLTMLLDRMPPAVPDPSFSSFVNHDDKAVQVVRRAGAQTTLLAFCGRYGSLGMPLPIAHRWFGPLGFHVVYLRDPLKLVFDSGVSTLAEDRAGTVRALRSIAEDLGATRIVCYGNSSGAYAALVYGLEIRAEAVLAFNAGFFEPDVLSGRHSRGGAVLASRDIRSFYLNAPRRPRVHLVYGASCAADAASAAFLSDVPGVTTEAVPGSDGHDAQIPLIARGQFGRLLHGLGADRNGWL